MLVFVTHYWGEKYHIDYVRKLFRAVNRNVKQQHRFIVATDAQWRFASDRFELTDIKDPELIKLPGCVCRLRLFDPEWQKSLSIAEGDRIVSLDIDLIITGQLDGLLAREDDFTILQGINTTNPCPFNGSIFMLRAGARPDVWFDYSPDANAAVPFHSFPDDQGWFHHKMPDAGAWGPTDGVYGFKKVGWPSGDDLPDGAKIVAFPGWRDPSMPMFQKVKWIKEHWQ